MNERKNSKFKQISATTVFFTAHLLFSSMTGFTLSAADLLCRCLSISVTVWLTLLLVFFLAPAVLGHSLGLSRVYVATLLNIFGVRLLSVAE